MLARRPTDDSEVGVVLLALDELATLSSMLRALVVRRTGVVNVSSCEAGPSSVGASVPASSLPTFISAIYPLLAATTLVRLYCQPGTTGRVLGSLLAPSRDSGSVDSKTFEQSAVQKRRRVPPLVP